MLALLRFLLTRPYLWPELVTDHRYAHGRGPFQRIRLFTKHLPNCLGDEE